MMNVISKRRNWMYLLIIVVIVGFIPKGLAAQELPPLSSAQASQAAYERMRTEVDAGRASSWVDATLNDPVILYDLSGAVSAYLFSVSNPKGPAGYLTVAAFAIPNPVLEFATDGFSPLDNLRQVQEYARSSGYELLTEKPLYLGLLGYAYELVSSSEAHEIIFVVSGEVTEIHSEQVFSSFVNDAKLSGENFVNTTAALAYKLIGGVPDWNQFRGSYGCASGCSPTAATNAIGYWDNHGYDNLIYGGDWQGAVNEMRTYMGTWCTSDGAGATYTHMISPGMLDYTQAHGYYFESHYWCNWCSVQPTYASYCSEIDADHPLVVCIYNHNQYNDHCVTGVGYNTNGNYMIVHDNWSSTGKDVNLQYGSGYSDIEMITAMPDSLPPTQVSNVQPDGWSGPYTSDPTPRFRWTAANDSGSGIAGYYVAVDDWTPEGGYENDWWAGNVTVFTVPNALIDGEHIFAVTSKDKAGNLNPTNTNQQGDAPYYTFWVDTQAPANPTTIDSGCSAQNGIWQRSCTDPAFSWSGATDHGAGIQDYHIYWGTDPQGMPSFWRSTANYDPGPVNTEGGVATYYLRISTRDYLGHESRPETVFTFYYDVSSPIAKPLVAGGAEVVHSLQVPIEPRGQDVGSGLDTLYLSNDGVTWHIDFYTPTTTWVLEPLNRQLQQVYLKVKDRAGNWSLQYPCWVCVDLFPAQPSSNNYRVWSAGVIIAGDRSDSSNYRLNSTAGQTGMSGSLASANYRLRSGFQALWPANPGAEVFTSFSCWQRIYLPITLREG